jgi:hypothetical protein
LAGGRFTVWSSFQAVRAASAIRSVSAVCPLFGAERAIRDVLGENGRPGFVLHITLSPELLALLTGELLPDLDEFDFPDFVPEEWTNPADDESTA